MVEQREEDSFEVFHEHMAPEVVFGELFDFVELHEDGVEQLVGLVLGVLVIFESLVFEEF